MLSSVILVFLLDGGGTVGLQVCNPEPTLLFCTNIIKVTLVVNYVASGSSGEASSSQWPTNYAMGPLFLLVVALSALDLAYGHHGKAFGESHLLG